MAFRRQLGQLRPSDTDAASVFTASEARAYRNTLLNIANVGTGAINVSVFHDRDGVVWDETTAIVFTHTLVKGGTLQITGMEDFLATGSIGVQTDTANDATFTFYGVLDGERQ